jgi:hypothetical protein
MQMQALATPGARRGQDSLPSMKPTAPDSTRLPSLQASFLSCVASVLELRTDELPDLASDEDPAGGPTVTRWLGGLGLGLARVADPQSFSWAGPWLARVAPPSAPPRFAVMFGIPSGVVWDPAGQGDVPTEWLADGYLIAAGDITLGRPALPDPPTQAGVVEEIWIAPAAGQAAAGLDRVRALPGRGLAGDRHVDGRGTFPSGLAGSALTLIEAEVIESFDPPLGADQHRRNVVTRGIELNRLVGHEFTVGPVRCRGMRLCEPCTVMQHYTGRPVLRDLVHRGGLRADILSEDLLAVGDAVRATLTSG